MDQTNKANESTDDRHADETNQLIEHTVETAYLLYQGDYEAARQRLDLILNGVNSCYTAMLNGQQRYQEAGVVIPVEVLTAQYQNMAEALQCGDLIKLADTLLYEIKEGLEFFKDINKQLQ